MGGRSPESPLLERAAELDVIMTAIDAARAGTGSVLLIEGAAGIGKTRLLAYACEQAAAADMTVLTARAAEYEDGYAWGVVRRAKAHHGRHHTLLSRLATNRSARRPGRRAGPG